MSYSEIRSLVTTYYRVSELEPLNIPIQIRRDLDCVLVDIQSRCGESVAGDDVGPWMIDSIGSVLAAGVASAVTIRDISSAGGALRIFGLTGGRAVSPQSAWSIMQPYIRETVLSPQSIMRVQQKAGVRLKLPDKPTPVQVLEELTRPRGSTFACQVAHWMAERFCREGNTHYGAVYQKSLDDLVAMNNSGEMAQFTGPNGLSGKLTKEDWEGLIRGRVPEHRIRLRAGFNTARQFIVDYWSRVNESQLLAS